MRILVGMPCGDMIHGSTALSVTNLLLHSRQGGEHEVGFSQQTASVPSQNQNAIFATALDTGADAVLLIDSDMAFPPDTLTRLLAHDLPVVGAVYRIRKHPFHLAFVPHPKEREISRAEKGLVLASHIASGMMLVRRPVLETMGYPWMEEVYGSRPEELVGHDVNFCRKARTLGFEVAADFGLSREVFHLGVTPIGLLSAA